MPSSGFNVGEGRDEDRGSGKVVMAQGENFTDSVNEPLGGGCFLAGLEG